MHYIWDAFALYMHVSLALSTEFGMRRQYKWENSAGTSRITSMRYVRPLPDLAVTAALSLAHMLWLS